jgi:ribonuclease D
MSSHPVTLPPPVYVDNDARLREVVAHLRRERLIAVDTESNSLHAYRERVCLIQLSTRSTDYIIDPLTIGDLMPLAPLFEDPAIEKVFHAAEYDLMCLKRDFGFRFNTLFDTMIAARICSIKQIGLGALLAQFIGIEVDKSHQRDDWGQRPLPADSLHYAQMDTHHLPELRDHLAQEIEARGHQNEAQETFGEMCRVRPASSSFDPEGYWRIAQTHHLSVREAAVLRELYLWREKMAEKRDCPPFKVIGDKALISLAVEQPHTQNDLPHLDGVGHGNARRYGFELLKLVERGKHAPLPTPPPQEAPTDPLVLDAYAALREWRKTRAAQRDVESDVIVSRETLWALATHLPTTDEELARVSGMGAWRLQTYGAELLVLVGKFARRRK